jgi:hypothetical protein
LSLKNSSFPAYWKIVVLYCLSSFKKGYVYMTNADSLLYQSYRSASVFYSTPPLLEQNKVIERARSGDSQSRESIITCCLPYVLTIAKSYSLAHNIEFEELVGVGNLELVEKLDIALTKRNAYSYLKAIIKRSLYFYCLRNSHDWELLDIDQSLEPIQPIERDYTFLYDAVSSLPVHLRCVVEAHYGLGDIPKQSLYELSLVTSANPKGSILYCRLRQAHKHLRTVLTV